MIEFDVYVPTNYNDGSSIPASTWESIQQSIIDECGGLTLIGPCSGYWINDDSGEVIGEQVYIFRCIAGEGKETYFRGLKQKLETILGQESVLIVTKPCSVL